MPEPKTHYSGAICYDRGRTTVHISAGFDACGLGASLSPGRPNLSRNKKTVTCKRCLTIISKAVHCTVHPNTCCTGPETK